MKVLAGTLTSAGSLIKQTQQVLAGSLTSSGALTRLTVKLVSGALTSVGALNKYSTKLFTGTLTLAGEMVTNLGGGGIVVGNALRIYATARRVAYATEERRVDKTHKRTLEEA